MTAAFSVKQWVFMYATLMASMFAGSSVVHAVLQPDLTIPGRGGAEAHKSQKQQLEEQAQTQAAATPAAAAAAQHSSPAAAAGAPPKSTQLR